jgi:DnaJ-class molecular chaperone
MTNAPKQGTPFEKKCPECNGTGDVEELCERCGGDGTIDEDRDGIGAPWECGNCSGTGKEKMNCAKCDGSGMVVDFFEREYEPDED